MQEFLFIAAVVFILFRLLRGNIFIVRFPSQNGQPPNRMSYRDTTDNKAREVKNDSQSKKKKSLADNEGDYIDYEEIK